MARNVILKAPTHVELAITEKCNHRCKHCYNEWRDAVADGSTLQPKQRNHILLELIKNEVSYVTLTGGEPLMESDTLFWFIKKLRENNIGVGLNTNLTLMSDCIAMRLVDEYNWKNTILTSLPGFCEKDCDIITQVSGSFIKIEKGIDICIRYGIPVGVNVVVTKENICKLDDLYSFLDKHSISVLSLTRVVPPIYNPNDYKYKIDKSDVNRIVQFLRKVKNDYGIRVTSLCSLPFCLLDDTANVDLLSTKCAAGIIGCSINAISGAVTPCAHSEQSYGNIYSEGLSSIWSRMNEWRNGELVPDECQECKMLPFCGGDCRLNSIRVSCKPYSLDANCTIKLEKRRSRVQFDKQSKYVYNNKTLLRQEEFGAVVSLGTYEFYVTKPVYHILCLLKEMQEFDYHALEHICVINDVLLNMLSQWINADILYIKE